MPPTSSSLDHFTCTRATDFPPFAWDALRRHDVNANVILPILLKRLKEEHAGIPVRDQLWIVVYTPTSHDVKLILFCTDSLTGKYPVFLFTPTPQPVIHSDPDTYPALRIAALELCQLHSDRVYSVFGPEILCRTLVTLLSDYTRIPVDPVQTLVDDTSHLHQLVMGEMCPAERKDLDSVAALCFEFATTVYNTLLVYMVSESM